MSMLETVRGPRDLASLGKVLMHEHVFILTPDVHQDYGDEYWDEDERIADAISKLETLKPLGSTRSSTRRWLAWAATSRGSSR